jgi:murein DD-endopeptidase MepM/ murein hydrolase activator NlpD
MTSNSRFVTLLLLLLFSSGCTIATVGPYGDLAYDGEPLSSKRKYALLPPEAPSISQGYKPEGFHYAIDIIEKTGTRVIAAAAGTIISSYYDPLYGNRMLVSHNKPGAGNYVSGYNHLQSRNAEVGSKVDRGQQIGSLGHTGLLSGGLPHLHFEIRNDKDLNLNPHQFWFDGVGIVTCFESNRTYDTEEFKTTYPVPCLQTQ